MASPWLHSWIGGGTDGNHSVQDQDWTVGFDCRWSKTSQRKLFNKSQCDVLHCHGEEQFPLSACRVCIDSGSSLHNVEELNTMPTPKH
ncbi:hypothetical protein J6590_077359 [Homalodisca vitripennis]|nr:hypothetical protein J6590_077359 [Homalodisca vitripennis]